ncbi:MAG: AraC family transcriptional regulator [Eubacteriales bacterium]|nr:AraC family transcriptional regulator [Eubacteriales bacterium]
MKQEFEIISYSRTNFKMFMVNSLYRTPHIHRDFEISYILSGDVEVFTPSQTVLLNAGNFWVMNPFMSHEIKAAKPALILSLQVPPEFFVSYYPQIENLEFVTCSSGKNTDAPSYSLLQDAFIHMAYEYFGGDEFYEFKCAALLNQIFFWLMDIFGYKFVSKKERLASRTKAERMRAITDYIDENYCQKLLLTDIAGQEHLSLYYLSHFFKDCFGMSFQEYLLRIRCEKARQLLLLSEQTLTDICFACGFSDPKYFNNGFKRQYGCTPKYYRKQFRNDGLEQQQKSMLTIEEFLTPEASLITLDRLL